MKRIAYMLDGKLCIVYPSEGARLAVSVRLADGEVRRNRVLVKAEIDEIIPASAILDDNGEPVTPESRRYEPAEYEDRPQPVDRFLRGWPVDGATAEWAETEAEFLERLRVKCVPAGAENVTLVEPADIPASREGRATWVLGPGGIVAGAQ